MSDWTEVSLNELGRIVTGKTPPTKSPELLGHKTAFITPTDIEEESIFPTPRRRLSSAGEIEFMRSLLPTGAVCFTCIASIGKMCMTREQSLTNQQINSIIVDQTRFSPRWVYYMLKDKRGQIASIASGSATPIINKTSFGNVRTSAPPLETQRGIASILGAYDDLIEVNRRRVAVLEEMARGLFEEWFVRFRFPGHERVSTVSTPDGPLPQGWRPGLASELVDFDPRTRVPAEGEKPFIPMGHLDTATSLIDVPEQRTGNSGAKFRNGDTLFARITPCLENGKTGLVRGLPGPDGVGFGSTEFIVMRGARAGSAFVYCLSRLPDFRNYARTSMSGASGRQRARTESVSAFELAIPPNDEILRAFEDLASPMLELVGGLGEAIRALSASRDLLLPRLISGELSVEAAERELETA